METTIIFAKLWGWLLGIVCLIFLLRKKILLAEMFKLVNDKGFTLLSGYIALTLGLVTVIFHNIWTGGWPVIITVFGWLSLIKGIVRIGFPEIFPKVISFFKKKEFLINLLLLVALLLSAWLLWISYLV